MKYKVTIASRTVQIATLTIEAENCVEVAKKASDLCFSPGIKYETHDTEIYVYEIRRTDEAGA